MRHPKQPVEVDKHGTRRFKENKIVKFLLDCGGYNMNELAAMPFSAEDRQQFAQLIGYSVSGFLELPYVGVLDMPVIDETVQGDASLLEAENKELKRRLASVTESARGLITELFRIHADDLQD